MRKKLKLVLLMIHSSCTNWEKKLGAEIISHSMILSSKHRFGTDLFGTQMDFRFAYIEQGIQPMGPSKKHEKKMEASRMVYDFPQGC